MSHCVKVSPTSEKTASIRRRQRIAVNHSALRVEAANPSCVACRIACSQLIAAIEGTGRARRAASCGFFSTLDPCVGKNKVCVRTLLFGQRQTAFCAKKQSVCTRFVFSANGRPPSARKTKCAYQRRSLKSFAPNSPEVRV